MTCALRVSMVLHVIQHVMRASGAQIAMGLVEYVKMRLHVTERAVNAQLVNWDIYHRFVLKSVHLAHLELIAPRLVIGKVLKFTKLS